MIDLFLDLRLQPIWCIVGIYPIDLCSIYLIKGVPSKIWKWQNTTKSPQVHTTGVTAQRHFECTFPHQTLRSVPRWSRWLIALRKNRNCGIARHWLWVSAALCSYCRCCVSFDVVNRNQVHWIWQQILDFYPLHRRIMIFQERITVALRMWLGVLTRRHLDDPNDRVVSVESVIAITGTNPMIIQWMEWGICILQNATQRIPSAING